MWGKWCTFNCSSLGQLCIVYLGLPVQIALAICQCSGNPFSSVAIVENFILGLLFLQWDYFQCGWQQKSSVSGTCWSFCSSPGFHRIREIYTDTWYVSHVNSNSLLEYLLFASLSLEVLCSGNVWACLLWSKIFSNGLCTNYSAVIPHTDTITPKQGESNWLYLESIGDPKACYLCLHHDGLPVQASL